MVAKVREDLLALWASFNDFKQTAIPLVTQAAEKHEVEHIRSVLAQHHDILANLQARHPSENRDPDRDSLSAQVDMLRGQIQELCAEKEDPGVSEEVREDLLKEASVMCAALVDEKVSKSISSIMNCVTLLRSDVVKLVRPQENSEDGARLLETDCRAKPQDKFALLETAPTDSSLHTPSSPLTTACATNSMTRLVELLQQRNRNFDEAAMNATPQNTDSVRGHPDTKARSLSVRREGPGPVSHHSSSIDNSLMTVPSISLSDLPHTARCQQPERTVPYRMSANQLRRNMG